MLEPTEDGPHPRYLVVTGAVAAGASTLAVPLAEALGATTLLEGAIEDSNPFFARSQRHPRRWGLANQAHFLTASVRRHRQLQALLERDDQPLIIEDRTPFEHIGAYVAAYEQLGLLPGDEAALLRHLGDDLADSYVTPGLLIYREMTDDQLAERVLARARRGESADLGRLTAIRDAFDDFIDRWQRGPVVRIPAQLDVLTESGFYDALQLIQQARGADSN